MDTTLEDQTQRLHEAGLTIGRLQANCDHLEEETREMKKALDIEVETRQRLEVTCRQNAVSIQQMTDALAEAQFLEKEALAKVACLEEQVSALTQQLASAGPLPAGGDVSGSGLSTSLADREMVELVERVAQLEEEKAKLDHKLSEAVAEIQQGVHTLSQLEREKEEKDEEIECLQSQLSAQFSTMERLREENQNLGSMRESENATANCNKRGNSLFSEVDDRRVAAESTLVKVQVRLAQAEEKLGKEQKENRRLKQQNTLLRVSSAKGSVETESEKSLQAELLESKRTIIRQNEQLVQLKASANKPVVTEYKPCMEGFTDKETQFINFLQAVIKKKERDIEAAKQEFHKEHAKVLQLELSQSLAEQDNRALGRQHQQLKVTNAQLTMDLQELQRKLEPEKYDTSPKELRPIYPEDNTPSEGTKGRSPLSHLHKNPSTSEAEDSIRKKTSAQSQYSRAVASLDKKEFDPFEAVATILGSNKENSEPRSRSVRMAEDVQVVTSEGAAETRPLSDDGQGKKPTRHQGDGSSSRRYRNITSTKENYDNVAECPQQ